MRAETSMERLPAGLPNRKKRRTWRFVIMRAAKALVGILKMDTQLIDGRVGSTNILKSRTSRRAPDHLSKTKKTRPMPSIETKVALSSRNSI